MEINNQHISISQTANTQKTFPFKVGELFKGSIINQLGDNQHLIEVGGKRYKAYYPGELKGEQLFKVIENKGQLVLKIMSPASEKNPSQQIISQFSKLEGLVNDPLLRQIVDQYLKYNLRLNETEILSLYRFMKEKKGKYGKGFLDLTMIMKSKGIRITHQKMQAWIDHSNNLIETAKELSTILKAPGDSLFKLVRQYYLISLSEGEIKKQLINSFLLRGYRSKKAQNVSDSGKIPNEKESIFITELLKFLSSNQDNKLIRKLIHLDQLERESIVNNHCEDDMYFLSIPIVRDDSELDYFLLKSHPEKSDAKRQIFSFEIELSHLKKVRGEISLTQGKIDINLKLEEKQAVGFLNQRFVDMYHEKKEDYLTLGNWAVTYEKETGDFLSDPGIN